MRIALILPLALLLTACQADSGPPDQPTPAYEFVLGIDEANRPVRIASGRWFGIRVTDNPSIGHQWSVAEIPDNLRSEGFLYEDEGDGAEGADTTKVFRFVGTAPGRGSVRLVLDYRGDPRRTVAFDVTTE